MDQFKVNVSKEALEEFYGRELSGQEVETARGVVQAKLCEMGYHWCDIDKDFPLSRNDNPVWAMWDDGEITSGDTDYPERPLSDFLPEPNGKYDLKPRPETEKTDGLSCAECRLNVDCLIYGTVPFCAVFESLTTGLGVEGTILNRKEAVSRVDGDGDFIGILEDFTPLHGEKPITPNCALCRWGMTKEYFAIGKVKICEAMAERPADDVYNTPECKALYKVKE